MTTSRKAIEIFSIITIVGALTLTSGVASAEVINVIDEFTTIHDAWANAQVAHAPPGSWSFDEVMVAPFSDQWKANVQIGDFRVNSRSIRTTRKPATSNAVWQQEQPQTSGASRAVVGSWGDTYHVPGDYPTIQQAIDNATGGETILVEPGRYNETLVINVSHLLLKANSTNPADTVVSANGTDDHVINITNQTNVTIEGFTIQDARGASQDVAGIFMDNTSECAVSNTVIRNISAVGSVDAYGVMMIGTTITPRLTDTTIRTILGENNSVGVLMENARNPSFDPTLIENVTAANGTAFGILMAVTDGSFYETTISDIAGNSSAYGILMIPAINVTFDPTIIERVTASAPNGEAYGIHMVTITGSFSNTTISDIAGDYYVYGIDMYGENVSFYQTVIERVNSSYGAIGINAGIINGSFTNTTISDIFGDYVALGTFTSVENVGFYQTVIERVNSSYGAIGICGYLINSSFTDTTISNISGDYSVYGIDMYGENVSFDSTVIERVNSSNGEACGIGTFYLINGSFTDTTIRDIFGNSDALGIYMFDMFAENVSFDSTVIERVNSSNGEACGIGTFYLINGSFIDTTIRDIFGNTTAFGIAMNAINVTFDPTIIERVTAPDGYTYGILMDPVVDGSFIDTTIRDISGYVATGIYMYDAINVSFLTGELTNCGHGLWLLYGDTNRIEGVIIRDNTLFDTGVHLESDTSNTTVYRNCFYNNVLQAWDNGTNNIWIGNYWEPPPGIMDDYAIPGSAGSRDNNPLQYCPMCAVEAPTLTPIGLVALVSLLATLAVLTITRRKRL